MKFGDVAAELRAWVNSPGGRQQIHQFLLKPPLWLPGACTWLVKLEQSEIALGYETYFIKLGEDSISAKLNARIIIHFGRKIAEEKRLFTAAVPIIRQIAHARTDLVISRRAQALLALNDV